MRKGLRLLALLAAIVLIWTALNLTEEKDPAYQLQLTTWAGQPAIGQLHRDDWYTFYHVEYWGGQKVAGSVIATFPAGEAAKLH